MIFRMLNIFMYTYCTKVITGTRVSAIMRLCKKIIVALYVGQIFDKTEDTYFEIGSELPQYSAQTTNFHRPSSKQK